MSVTKMYSVLDKWTDLEKENIVDFTSVDGVVTQARLNGVPVGGGGGGTAVLHFVNSTGDGASCLIPYACDDGWDVPCVDVLTYTPVEDEDITLPLYNGYCCCKVSSDYSLEYSDGILDQGDNYFIVGSSGGTVTMSSGGGGGV